MKPSRLLLFLAAASLALPSCNSSKIAYGNSYYFKATPKPATRKAPPVNAVSFYASAAASAVEGPKVTDKITTIASPENPETKQFQQADLSRIQKKEIRQERRAERKDLKKEIKKLVRAHREGTTTAPHQMEGLIKAGVIVGIAGLVMLLVGVLVANGAFLTTLGGIFLAVGLVLILVRLL